VGIDFTLAALDAALGISDTSSNESFQRVVTRSTARCPILDLTPCELESYRRQSNTVGDDALCNATCAEEDFVQVTEEKCPGVSDYPGDLWINLLNKGVAYSDRACCRVGGPVAEPDPTCTAPPIEDDSGPPIAVIVGSAVGGCVLLIAVVVFYLKCCKKDKIERPLVHAIPIPAVTVRNNDEESAPSQPGQIGLGAYTVSTAPQQQQQPQQQHDHQHDRARSESERTRSFVSAAQQESGTVVASPVTDSMEPMPNAQQVLLEAVPGYKDQCRHLDGPTSDAGNNSSNITANTGDNIDEAASATPNSESWSGAPTDGDSNSVAASVEVPLEAIPAPTPDLPPVEASPMIGPMSHIPATSTDGGDPVDDAVAFRLDDG